MKIRSPKDFWSGLFFLAVALAFIGLASQYHMGTMHKMGPALFPTLVGALLAGLGLILTVRALAIDGPPVLRFYGRPILVSILAMFLFGIVLASFGLIAAIAALVIVGAAASRESKSLETVGLVVALAAFSAAIFVYLLGLPIPLWPES